MLGTVIGSLFPTIAKTLDKVIPDLDASKRRAFEAEIALLEAQTRSDIAQMEVNAAEASHPSTFVAGWRPFIGWVCGLAIAFHFFGLSSLVEHITGAPVSVGSLEELWPVVMGMLGMGGLRTYEKGAGIARTVWRKK